MELTKHSKERYAERILGKVSLLDINSFIASNEEKIQKDIETMLSYGQMVFKGKPLDATDKQPVRVYLCGTWVIILDGVKDKVITLYKIDLGLGEEFNVEYVNRLTDKLNAAKADLDTVVTEAEEKKKEYQEYINENTAMINEYRGYIKNLEKLNDYSRSKAEAEGGAEGYILFPENR